MRSRPYVDLKIPSAVHPGSTLRIGVSLEATSRTPVDFIEVDVQGRERAADTEQTRSHSRTILSKSVRIAEAFTLEEGKQLFEATIDLPDDIPFSYTGYLSEIQYSVGAHISIPWWFDAAERKDLIVVPPPIGRPARFPIIASQANTTQPFVEFVVDDRYYSPGEEITGALALGNAHERRVEGVDVSLVGRETLRFPQELVFEAHRTTLCLKAGSGDEGKEIGFRLRIPRNVSPTFDAGSIALNWLIEVRLQFANSAGPGRTMPIVMGAYSAPQSTPPPNRIVGSQRWRSVWAECAARAGFSLSPTALEISGSAHDCEIKASADLLGEQSSQIAGEIQWPALGLSLSLRAEGFTEQLFGSNEDRVGKYRIQGRDGAQCRALFTAELRQILQCFNSIELDDRRAVVTKRGPIHDGEFVSEFLGDLEAVARAVQQAEDLIPPPPGMSDVAGEWRALARELHCRLIPGSLSIAGAQFEGGLFHLETHFGGDGHPSFLRIVLRAGESMGTPFDSQAPNPFAALPPPAREIAESLCTNDRIVRGSKKRIELDIPDPCTPPVKLKDWMRAMIVLEQRLRGERRVGPYR